MVAGRVASIPGRSTFENPVDMPKFMTTAIGSIGMTRCPTLPLGPIARASRVHASTSATDHVTWPVGPGL